MIKICPRCGTEFECCSDGDVSRCHCSRIALSDSQRMAIRAQYSDCLCHDCLLQFSDSQIE